MGIVHSWFQSVWSWIAVAMVFGGLLLASIGGRFQYAGAVCMVLGLILFFLSPDEEDYTKV